MDMLAVTPEIESRLPNLGTSIFTIMSSLARKEDALNLSQGFPDFDPDPELMDLVAMHMHKGGNQYSPSSGHPKLTEQISKLVAGVYGVENDPVTEITVTSGATEALFCAISAVVGAGDEVIIIEPAYDSYAPVVTLAGGVPKFVGLKFPDYQIDWDKIRQNITPKTKLIILNSPHNPTGSIIGADDIRNLESLVEAHPIFILSDEVYEHIVFDGAEHHSILKYPALRSRAFVVSSFGKSFHNTGWKVGYCIAPEKMTTEFRKIHQYVTFSTSTPFQLAFADYLGDPEKVKSLGTFYQRKRDHFLDAMKGSSFRPLACGGTYFQLFSYEGISSESDVDFARTLTIQHKVASIPISVFYADQQDNKVLRFCFAKGEETLERAANILRKI